jgi:hypothetical protein
MSEQTALKPVEQLVLARLLVAGEKGATGNDFKKALEPIVGHQWSGAALNERLAEILTSLDGAGLILRTRKGRTERATLTPKGRQLSLEFVGMDELPPRTTWDKIKKTALTARALGLVPPRGDHAKLFSTDNGFKAVLLRRKRGLPLNEFPKIEQAIDALAWALLGFAPGRKFDVKSVQAALILRALGDDRDPGPKPDPKKELAKLLANEVGARQSGKDELRLATLRQWVDGHAAAPLRPDDFSTAELQSEPNRTADSTALESPGLDLSGFAQRVLQAARSSVTGHFGANKVFISHVWQALQGDQKFTEMGLAAFKRRLAEANNARLLDLSRADMVEAMDPEDVRFSEVSYLGATFHFIRI